MVKCTRFPRTHGRYISCRRNRSRRRLAFNEHANTRIYYYNTFSVLRVRAERTREQMTRQRKATAAAGALTSGKKIREHKSVRGKSWIKKKKKKTLNAHNPLPKTSHLWLNSWGGGECKMRKLINIFFPSTAASCCNVPESRFTLGYSAAQTATEPSSPPPRNIHIILL